MDFRGAGGRSACSLTRSVRPGATTVPLMLQIILVRHGRPACDDRTPIAGWAFGAWVRGYDDAPIDVTVPPPASLRARASAIGCIATSSLRRARESAAVLAADRTFVYERLFAEAGIPSSIHLSLALPPRLWTFLSRVAWCCGWSRGVESLREARRRALRAAERLVELASEHGSVMLVGHGVMNTLISGALRRSGWRGSASGSAFWSVGVLQRAA